MHFAVSTCVKKERSIHFQGFSSQLRELCCLDKLHLICSTSACWKCVSVSFTWSLEVDASHLHRVCGVMGRNVCVVQQALCPRLRLFSFATAERPGDKKTKVMLRYTWTRVRGLRIQASAHTYTHRSLITNMCSAEAGYFHFPCKCRENS